MVGEDIRSEDAREATPAARVGDSDEGPLALEDRSGSAPLPLPTRFSCSICDGRLRICRHEGEESMSPMKSPGQRAGQSLARDGREVVGRSVDLEFDQDRPHFTNVGPVPEAILGHLDPGARAELPDEPWVFWRPCFDNYCECGLIPDPEGLLDEFLALEGGTTSDVERFILHRGPIAGCIHLIPHSTCTQLLSSRTAMDGTPSSAPLSLAYWEAPFVYRKYSRIFRTVLTLAAAIQSEDDGALGTWVELFSSIPSRGPAELSGNYEWVFGLYPAAPTEWSALIERMLTVGLARHLLARAVNLLLDISPIELILTWPFDGDRTTSGSPRWYPGEAFEPTPRIRPSGDTFGVLSYQLAIAVQGGNFAVCTNCRQTYAPARRPQRGRDNYCPACRDVRKTAYKRRRHQGRVGEN